MRRPLFWMMVGGGAALAGAVWLPTIWYGIPPCDGLSYFVGCADRLAGGTMLSPRAYYRPVVEVIFAVVWSAFGPWPVPYRALAVGAHLLNGGLVFLMGRALRMGPGLSALAAGLFLLSSIHHDTVLWSTGLLQALGGTGAFVCAVLILRGWLWGWRAAAVVSVFAVGVFAYPFLILLPVAIFAAWQASWRARPRPTALLLGTTAVAAGWVVLEALLPVIRSGGQYPHLGDVSRNVLLGPLTMARNVVASLVYAWWPAAPLEGLPTWPGRLAKLIAFTGAAVAAAGAWRRGPEGRWLLLWTALGTFPFVLRHIVDARQLYVTAAGMSLVLAMAAGGIRGRLGTGVRAALVILGMVNVVDLHRWTSAHREAGALSARLVEAVQASSSAHRPGGVVVLRGFPRWVGRPPWAAPFLLYPPHEAVVGVLRDSTVEVVLLEAGQPVPRAPGRSRIVVDMDRLAADR